MKRDAKAYLFEIRRAADLVNEFTTGITFEEYEGDVLVRSATERQLGILGEATGQLAYNFPAIAARISDYPQIIAFRNILIHEYHRVHNDMVWEKIQDYLPHLAEEAQALLDALSTEEAEQEGER